MLYSMKTVFTRYVPALTSQAALRHLKTGKKDPGIGARKKLVSLINDNPEDVIDFEDLESDFMDIHKSHKEHEREMETQKEREKFHIVKQKYFKEKFPNFLTWHDKEQIRNLHQTDPDEWTTDRLAEGFPALPETIKKIVKSNWSKTKQNKITNHDFSVQKNWKLFKDGQMTDLPQELVEHLNKFTNRTLNFKPFIAHNSKPTFESKKSNVGTEFADIITSYKNLKSKTTGKSMIESTHSESSVEDINTMPLKTKSKMLTFNQFQNNLKQKLEVGGKINKTEATILTNYNSQRDDSVGQSTTDPSYVGDMVQKYHTSSDVQIYEKTERDMSHLNYPEKITIPKAIFKKGFIYKLNDCYYDDDGEFLYRVPGMG